jgi:hypothetical protein
MPTLNLADSIGLVGVALSGVGTWCQFRRARQVSVEGISLTTWFQFILMGLFWVGYGLAQHAPIIVAGSALCFPMQVAIVARLSPLRHLAHLAVGTSALALCCVVPTVAFGWSAGALGCGVAMAVNRLPQVIDLVRFPSDFGVSVASWALGAVCSVAWIGYYEFAHLWAALAATVAGMLGNVAIAALASWRHHQRAAANGDELVRPLSGGAERSRHALQTQS